jgi:Domain of unknown function (DUF4411)
LIDTDVLEHIRSRSDSRLIYDGLIVMAEAGSVKTVRQVFGELKKHKEAHKILKPHEREFILPTETQYSAEVQQKLELVKMEASHLWQQIGGKNPDPADPWLIAVASAYGYNLVTDENQFSTTRIPAACKRPNLKCRCISGPNFLIEVGLVQEIKPEHINPHSFFGLGQSREKDPT